jgi:SAM-dependent methyltransferase
MPASLSILKRSFAQFVSMGRPEPGPGPAPEAPPSGEDPYETELARTRTALAQRYIRGSGIEFGALHFPLRVPADATVTYADFEPVERIKELFGVATATAPHIVSDLETMRGIGPESQDFVIANHVLEHVEDPLRALRAVSRALRPQGIAYMALPDKRFTFDKDRETTSLEHLLRDHAEGPDWSLASHYEEWVRVVDGMTGDAYREKVELMLKTRANIHFHVWDFAAMLELFAHVERDRSYGLRVENATLNPVEVIWILRKA